MQISHSRRSVWSLLLLVTFGCTKESPNKFPVPSPGEDGGPPGRIVADVALPSEEIPDATSGAGEASPDVPLLKISVDIVMPKKDEVVVASDRFTPSVDVTIDSSRATEADTVSELLATVTKMGAKTSAASAKLSETKLEQMPEASLAVHRFTDTPVDISKLESGVYILKAAVKTVGGLMAESSVTFTIDAGPIIRIDSPGEDKYYRNSVTVDVTITDPLFGPVDKDKVVMLLGQQPLTFMGPSGPSNSQYSGTIQFGSYDPPLEGDQLLTVRATNKNGTQTVVRRKFVSDNKGPTITNTVPKTGDLIGRVVTISAQVTDPAGVLDSSVVAVIAHGDTMFEVKLQAAAAGSMAPPGTYQALFDTARLPTNALFPSVSFRASDLPGNQSSVGYLVSLDNTPPLADLDPPTNFHLVKKVDDVDRCSWPFDPVGGDAVDDKDNVAQIFDVRARIEDQGNAPLAGTTDFTPISGIDDTRAQLLILDDTDQPLVVDTNGDGVCDAVNPLLTPTTTPMSARDALLVNMVPVPPAGGGNYMPRMPDPGAPCASGNDNKPPDPLCDTTNLTAAIYYATTGTAAIWTIPPIVNDKLQCVGRQFDSLGNNFKDGWICMAIAVADKLGNAQVSRPLRVCVNKDGLGDECGASRPAPPDCTGTVTATKPAPVVDATKPCRPWAAFPPTEYRRSN